MKRYCIDKNFDRQKLYEYNCDNTEMQIFLTHTLLLGIVPVPCGASELAFALKKINSFYLHSYVTFSTFGT